MPNLTQTIESISSHIGFPKSRLRTLARALLDADTLPSGAPGVSPVVAPPDVLALIVAAASGATLRRAAATTAAYMALTPGGANVSTAPASIPASAGAQLAAIAELASEGDNGIRRLKVAVTRNWPEIAIHHPDGTIHRFQAAGALTGHWAATGHRDAVTINGAAFADVFIEIFARSAK